MALPTDINPFVQFAGGASGDLGEPIEQSLRFNTSGYLTLAQSSPLVAVNRNWTFSTWFKHGDMGETNIFGFHSTSQNNWILSWVTGSSYDTFLSRDHTGWQQYDGTQKFRDTNAWYHIFMTCSSGVMTMKVNNVARGGTVTQNHSMDRDFVLGAEHTNGGSPMDAYLAETYFIQDSILDPVNDGFIRLNEDGIYVPDTPTISDYGTNGWHLTYDSSQANGIGHDSSGNGNHFTATGFDTTAISSTNNLNDIDIADTPTSNYAVFNPLWPQTTPSVKGGNMELTTANTITGQASFRFPVGTTGKYWVEAGTASYNGNLAPAIVLTDQLDAAGLSNTAWSTTANYSAIGGYESSYSNFTSTSATSYTDTGPTVALGINFDDDEVLMYNGGTLINTDTTVDFTKELAVTVMQPVTSYNTYDPYINAGQQTFKQTPPTGYKALQTNNLPEPTIKNGKKHFDVYSYTSASTAADISFTGWEFQPDLVWFKSTSHGSSHRLYDSVRGVNKGLQSNTSNAEGSDTDAFNSFDSNGFSLGTGNSDINYDSRSYVAWGWKAGGTAVSNTDGTITSSVSANTTAGFSIVSYTGNNTSGATIGHGLNSAPQFMIVRNRDDAEAFAVYHQGADSTAPEDYWLRLDNNSSRTDSSTHWNDTAPTNSVFTVGNANATNGNSDAIIAYCWHGVEGFSKFGSYTGNNDNDGPFVYLGFKPAFLLIKRRGGTANWMMFDSTRDTHNPCFQWLEANEAAQEQNNQTAYYIDFLSNGFKLRGAGDATNNSTSDTYIYMTFAESPFGGQNVPPATAR